MSSSPHTWRTEKKDELEEGSDSHQGCHATVIHSLLEIIGAEYAQAELRSS